VALHGSQRLKADAPMIVMRNTRHNRRAAVPRRRGGTHPAATPPAGLLLQTASTSPPSDPADKKPGVLDDVMRFSPCNGGRGGRQPSEARPR